MKAKQAIFGNMSNNTIKLVIILFGVIIAACGYYFGYSKLVEKAETVEAVNADLAKEETTLKKMDANKENNELLATAYFSKGDKTLDKYPAVLHSEDTIAYAISWEKKANSSLLIDDIDISELEVIYITDENGAISDPDAETSVQDQAAANGSATVSVNNVDASLTAEEKSDIANYGITHDYSYALCKTPATYSFTVGYSDLKTVLKTIRASQDKQSIESVSLVYDKETGNLNGSLIVNQYTIAGTGKGYTEPRFDKSSIGNDSPFSTLE